MGDWCDTCQHECEERTYLREGHAECCVWVHCERCGSGVREKKESDDPRSSEAQIKRLRASQYWLTCRLEGALNYTWSGPFAPMLAQREAQKTLKIHGWTREEAI